MENINQLYLRAEKELEAHIWWFCSTHEYYKTTKYEPPTPPQLGDRTDYFFRKSQKVTLFKINCYMLLE